jgi:hypothetical protein
MLSFRHVIKANENKNVIIQPDDDINIINQLDHPNSKRECYHPGR